MNFEYSNKVKDLQDKLTNFMNEHVYKNEAVYKEEVEKGGRWCVPKIMEDMKSKAKAQGLWNLFLPESDLGAGLTNTEYADVRFNNVVSADPKEIDKSSSGLS